MVIYLKYYRCRCLRWFKYKFIYHEKEKAATGLEPVTAKPFLPNPYLAYFDKLGFVSLSTKEILHQSTYQQSYGRNYQIPNGVYECRIIIIDENGRNKKNRNQKRIHILGFFL